MENSIIPINPNLKKLKLYDSVLFSLKQYTSVNTTIQRLQTQDETVRFTMKKNNVDKNLKVTRIA